MIGKIINIANNVVYVKLNIDMSSQTNLVNIHVVFEDKDIKGNLAKIVGEINNINLEVAEISIVGEIVGERFIPGLSKKPSFKSEVRIITMNELYLILGNPTITDNSRIYLGQSVIYPGYKINVGVNDLFSNHFALLGNTGSGKSCTMARLVQNIFTSTNYLPVNANILMFDAFGEYNNAFSKISEISPTLHVKTYTTNVNINESNELLRIPLWLLGVDDIALLLSATEHIQLSIIEKTLKLVPILIGDDEMVIKYRNDIIARAILDILRSGIDSSKIRDQVLAILSIYNTKELNLESVVSQPGYNRPLKQLLYIDKTGKLQEMELIVEYISGFIVEGLEIPDPKGDVMYTLKDLELALEFALISEGVLKSDKVFDYANILTVRLHSLVNSSAAEYFNYPKLVTRVGYINDLISTKDGGKAQIVNFNINYVNDRLAKSITKIISKMVFDFSTENPNRGSTPFHIIIEEAHRYVQNDSDAFLLGYNIFDRITKEGRKYGVMLGLITQRPSELSETSISQCANFIILRTLHPKDLKYIKEMIPNISDEIISHLKVLQPGNAIAFGSAFKVPIEIKFDRPVPEPLSSNCDVSRIWYGSRE